MTDIPNAPGATGGGAAIGQQIAQSGTPHLSRVVLFMEPILAVFWLALKPGVKLPEAMLQEKANALNKKLTEMIDRELVIQDAVAKLKDRGARFLKELQKAARKEFDDKWVKRIMRGNKLETEEDLKQFLRANGMPTNVAVFPNSVDPRGPGARSNFGNFLSTGGLGASYAPFVPGAGGQMHVGHKQRSVIVKISDGGRDAQCVGGARNDSRYAKQQCQCQCGVHRRKNAKHAPHIKPAQ